MIGAQSDLIGRGAGGSESGGESGDVESRASRRVRLVFGSITVEAAASVAGSIHPSSDGAICSGLRAGVVAGVISQTLSDSRVKSCSS